MKKSKQEQLISDINEFVSANSNLFLPNTIYEKEDFVNLLAPVIPYLKHYYRYKSESITKANLAIVTPIAILNRVLAFNGIYVKSVNYQSYFKVLPIEQTIEVSQSQRRRALSKQKTYEDLATGIVSSHGVWQKYSSERVSTITDRIRSRIETIVD